MRENIREEKFNHKGCKEEVKSIDWEQVIVITKRDFHDDWGRILEILQQQVEEPFIINPFQPDKALLKCPSKELAELLTKNRGWVSFGPIILKVEKWDRMQHSRIMCVPSYGGWIKIRNLPLHLWHLSLLKAVGDRLGDFIEYEEENSLLLDCVEIRMKIRENYCGFIPAEVRIIDGEDAFNVQVVKYQEGQMLIDKVAGIHGCFSPPAVHAFHRSPLDPEFGPTEIWRIENGIDYPEVNTRVLMAEKTKDEGQLGNFIENFELSRQKGKNQIYEEAGPSKSGSLKAQWNTKKKAQGSLLEEDGEAQQANEKKRKGVTFANKAQVLLLNEGTSKVLIGPLAPNQRQTKAISGEKSQVWNLICLSPALQV